MNDLPKFQKLMEDIIEFLLSNENEDENFSEFCENKMIEKIISISQFKERSINLIIIKTFGILIPSLKNNKIMFYLFSNNYMNQIITNISYNKEDNDSDYLSFYISFLKTLVNKLDIASFSLFFNSCQNKFPLLDEIIIFLTYDQDVMIKNTSRNIFLYLLKLNYEPFIDYICELPTITLFLLFAENLKKQMKFFCQNKESINTNNNIINTSYSYKINELEEREEILIDDISFIQDILSVNIPKINYLLINTIFSIPIGYLFNNILTKLNANVSYYILQLFIQIIQNEDVKNIITFILFSSRIQIKVIEIVANEETNDILRLLELNKYLFHSNINNIKDIIHHNLNTLSFDDYIILNYSKNFLNSIRNIKDTDDTYLELKDISNELNSNENQDNDINISIKLLNRKVDKINFVIKQIENYHGFISRATGINCGAAENAAKDCFLQIIYNNLMAYKENNIKKNIYLQENIFKKECSYYLYDFHLSQYMCTVNELFLIYEIINNEGICQKLKLNLNLLKDSNDKSKNENSKNIFININAIDETETNDSNPIIKKKSKSKEIGQNFDTPPAPAYGSIEVNAINDLKEENNKKNDISFSIIEPNNSNIYKQIFGTDVCHRSLKRSYTNYTTFLSLPNPIHNNFNINKFNNNINLIVDNKIMRYSNMEFNNEFFNKILMNYKENNELKIVEKLINLIIDGKRYLNKIIYKLSIDIIEDLIINSLDFWSIKRKYQNKINEEYKQILQKINDFLNKNTLIEQTKNYYFYEYFEECFIFNTKSINKEIKKRIFKMPILLTNPPKEEEMYEEQLDLLKIPEDKYQLIKCLFQKMLCLYDLKYIINNFNDVNKENLLKYQKFPLYFFDLSEFNIDNKINISKLKIESYKIKFKLEKEALYNEGLIFINKNYLFIGIPDIKNKIIEKQIIENKKIKEEENKKEEVFYTIKGDDDLNDIKNKIDDFFIIKQRIPLRYIELAYGNYKESNNKGHKNKEDQEKSGKILLLIINNKTKIKLLFDNLYNYAKIRNIIKDSIEKALEMEYNNLKLYINKLLNDYSTINN